MEEKMRKKVKWKESEDRLKTKINSKKEAL